MTLSRLAFGLLLAAGSYQSAGAAVISSVNTSVESASGFFDQHAVSPDDASAKQVHAWGSTLIGGQGFATSGIGALPCGGAGQTLCFSQGNSDGAAFATSVASGTTGSLHVSASANAALSSSGRTVASAQAGAGLRDKLTFQGAPIINIDLDLTRSALGENWSHGLNFSLDLCAAGGCASSSFDLLTISILRFEGPFGDDSVFTLRYYDAEGNFVETQDSTIPGSIDLALDLSFLGGAEFEIQADLTVFATVEDGATGIHADQSLYLQMDNVISESGYTYAGRLIDEPPVGIPSPSALVLLVPGLAALARVRRRVKAA